VGNFNVFLAADDLEVVGLGSTAFVLGCRGIRRQHLEECPEISVRYK